MRIVHPEALDGVGGQCPDRVGLGGDTYDCGDGLAFDVSRSQADALAERYGVGVADIAVDDETAADPPDGATSDSERTAEEYIEDGECPWCDDYEGDHVGQHASSAHPDAWEGYKE